MQVEDPGLSEESGGLSYEATLRLWTCLIAAGLGLGGYLLMTSYELDPMASNLTEEIVGLVFGIAVLVLGSYALARGIQRLSRF